MIVTWIGRQYFTKIHIVQQLKSLLLRRKNNVDDQLTVLTVIIILELQIKEFEKTKFLEYI